jgi:hypothetical protein
VTPADVMSVFPLFAVWRPGGACGDDWRGDDRQDRRAYFEQQLPIKEIVRTLSVSRSTVRKVIRSKSTEFKYPRDVQPRPKLGEWVEVLTEILEQEAKLPRRERRPTQRLFEELRGRGYDGARQRAPVCQGVAERACPGSGPGVRADELCPWRGVSVRLEPRDDPAAGAAADDQGGAHEAISPPHAVRACLFPRDPGTGVRRSR